MEKAYKIFNNPEFGDIRVLNQNGCPWFVAKEVCDVLGIVNHIDAISRLDEDEKGVANIYPLNKPKRGGGLQKTNIINESGMYALIFQSRKPFAKAFRKWVTSEVLPTIHRTGCYKVAYPYRKRINALEKLRALDRERLDILQNWVLNIQSERDILAEKVEGYTEIVCTRDFSESEILLELGKVIKEICYKCDITPSALSQFVGKGMSPAKFHEIVKGKEDIPLSLFFHLLKAMDYSLQFVKNKNLIE